MFAEMLVEAQGFGDPDEIAKTMTLVDIIYEMKKAEEKKKKEPDPEPVAAPVPEEPEEPEIIVKIKDFWSRLTHDSDSDE
ncbi:hypothetical protein EBT31_07110 [bacterium]|nr:hypothetical protein [bacterium]NBX48729.1 hypothetical protein [bacterium]